MRVLLALLESLLVLRVLGRIALVTGLVERVVADAGVSRHDDEDLVVCKWVICFRIGAQEDGVTFVVG